jgi:hypothetical protein
MDFPVWQIVVFLLIDFVILASVVAGIFFLVLFLKTRKQNHIRVVDLNDLDAFKNKNLQEETNTSIKNNQPVAPSTIKPHSAQYRKTDCAPQPVLHNEENSKMFNCQMQQNMHQMNADFVVAQQGDFAGQMTANTNYLNM